MEPNASYAQDCFRRPAGLVLHAIHWSFGQAQAELALRYLQPNWLPLTLRRLVLYSLRPFSKRFFVRFTRIMRPSSIPARHDPACREFMVEAGYRLVPRLSPQLGCITIGRMAIQPRNATEQLCGPWRTSKAADEKVERGATEHAYAAVQLHTLSTVPTPFGTNGNGRRLTVVVPIEREERFARLPPWRQTA